MFKHIVRREYDEKFLIRRLTFFGWEYYGGDYWWTMSYAQHIVVFDKLEDAQRTLLRLKNKVTIVR